MPLLEKCIHSILIAIVTRNGVSPAGKRDGNSSETESERNGVSADCRIFGGFCPESEKTCFTLCFRFRYLRASLRLPLLTAFAPEAAPEAAADLSIATLGHIGAPRHKARATLGPPESPSPRQWAVLGSGHNLQSKAITKGPRGTLGPRALLCMLIEVVSWAF